MHFRSGLQCTSAMSPMSLFSCADFLKTKHAQKSPPDKKADIKNKKRQIKICLFNNKIIDIVLLYAFHICSGAGIDPDFIALVDKQRYLNVVSRFQDSGFVSRFGRITLNTGFGFRNG